MKRYWQVDEGNWTQWKYEISLACDKSNVPTKYLLILQFLTHSMSQTVWAPDGSFQYWERPLFTCNSNRNLLQEFHGKAQRQQCKELYTLIDHFLRIKQIHMARGENNCLDYHLRSILKFIRWHSEMSDWFKAATNTKNAQRKIIKCRFLPQRNLIDSSDHLQIKTLSPIAGIVRSKRCAQLPYVWAVCVANWYYINPTSWFRFIGNASRQTSSLHRQWCSQLPLCLFFSFVYRRIFCIMFRNFVLNLKVNDSAHFDPLETVWKSITGESGV